MHIVPNEHLFHRMNERKIPPRFRCVICKRFMYRVGSAIVHEGEALVLVTGENLGQVASQTLANLATISDAANVPLIRPLITYDKAEIISRGRGIGTFPGSGGDLSCRAVPQKPATDASRETVHHLEEKLDLSSLVAEALSRRVMISALSGEVTGRDS
jgi:thiamine biosynthesis protein ThiI